MKKNFTVFFLSFVVIFLIFEPSYVQALCEDRAVINGERVGFVPCGIKSSTDPNFCRCELGHFFVMLDSVFNFIVWKIVTPLAVFMLTIGGVMILISGGNPNLANWGKRILWISIIGLALVFCSWLIIDFILRAMGYKDIGTWFQSPF